MAGADKAEEQLFLPSMSAFPSEGPIDAVVIWVDGDDSAHKEKRARYLGPDIAGHAKSEFRFRSKDEIRYCLRSIRNHAPWIRKIWIVTDNQFPDSIDKAVAESEGIHVVDHREIFAGHESLLPTFNSVSIEAFMWRIPGLSDRFIYFNDDTWLGAPVTPSDFFLPGKVQLRGRWKSAEKMKRIPWGIHNQISSANVTDSNASHFWGPVHMARPMVRPVLEAIYNANRQAFERNAQRFRKKEQWWSVAVHDVCLIKNDLAQITPGTDTLHFSVVLCRKGEPARVQASLARAASHGAKLICVNDFGALTIRRPDTPMHITAATGPARPFEKVPIAELETKIALLRRELADIRQMRDVMHSEMIAERSQNGRQTTMLKSGLEEAELKVQHLTQTVRDLSAQLKAIRERPFRYMASRAYRGIIRR